MSLNTITVKLWDETVGYAVWYPEENLAEFEYDKRFVQKGFEVSPIKMPLNSRVYRFPELKRIPTFNGIPGLLSDTIPDRFGKELIDSWLATQNRSIEQLAPTELLSFIGKRGMGALEFEPNTLIGKSKLYDIDLSSIVEVTNNLLYRKEEFVTNMNEDTTQAMLDVVTISTSAGGARPKAVIGINKETGEIKSGQTELPEGFEHFLIKLDTDNEELLGKSRGWGNVEYAYYKMATDCGINMSFCDVIEEGNRTHFITKRFDRINQNEKVHVQSFCGLTHRDYNNPLAYNYDQLFQTIQQLGMDYDAQKEMFRRMVFNVIAVNCDDHTKNFGFMRKKEQDWELTPAYDVCFAFSDGHKYLGKHQLGIGNKRENISEKDLIDFAKSKSLSNPQKVIKETREIIREWPYYANQTKVPEEMLKKIESAINLNNVFI